MSVVTCHSAEKSTKHTTNYSFLSVSPEIKLKVHFERYKPYTGFPSISSAAESLVVNS